MFAILLEDSSWPASRKASLYHSDSVMSTRISQSPCLLRKSLQSETSSLVVNILCCSGGIQDKPSAMCELRECPVWDTWQEEGSLHTSPGVFTHHQYPVLSIEAYKPLAGLCQHCLHRREMQDGQSHQLSGQAVVSSNTTGAYLFIVEDSWGEWNENFLKVERMVIVIVYLLLLQMTVWSPGWVAELVRVLSKDAKMASLVPCQGTYKN